MSYRTAYEHSDVIAGICQPCGLGQPLPCLAPANPCACITQFTALADGLLLYSGSEIRGNIYPSAVEKVERLGQDTNGCTG